MTQPDDRQQVPPREPGSPDPEATEFPTNSDLDSPHGSAVGGNDREDATISLADVDSTQPPKRMGKVQTHVARKQFGEYELVEEIARGGMGIVYKAYQGALKRTVALKMILAGQLAGEEEILRFRAEAEASAALDHPGIVPIYEVGQHEGQYFFSMGFVEGQSLAQRIAESPLASREAAQMLMGIADAVQYAHQRGIVHRDLKPSNVLLRGRGTAGGESTVKDREASSGSRSAMSSHSRPSGFGSRPMITDFGLAKRLESDSNITASGQVLGTPSYMPPEQAKGLTDQIDARSDVYSIGAILYCMLTGRPPFHAASLVETLHHVIELPPVPPRQINPEISRDLETICLKCLEKEPARRYPTAQALADDLHAFLDGRPVKSRPVGPIGKLLRWAQRKPVVASLSLAVMLVSLGGIAGIVWQWRVAQANFLQSQLYLSEARLNLTRAESEKQRADEQRAQADEQRAQAEASFDLARATVQRFLTIVPNHELVQQPGMEPVKKQLQTLGRDYYLKLIEARPEDLGVLNELAQSHFFLALTLEDVGDKAEAATEYDEAATIYQQLVDCEPEMSEHRRNLAACFGNLANVQIDLGQRAEGIATYRRIRDMQQAITVERPDDSIAELHLAMTYLNLGLLELDDGQIEAALKSATRASEMATDLQTRFADDLQIQFVLAKAFSVTGRLHWEDKHNPMAMADYERAADAYRSMLQEQPDNPQFLTELSAVFNDMAMLYVEQGDIELAGEYWARVIEYGRKAHEIAPHVQMFRENLSIKYHNRGLHYRNFGEFDRAIADLIEARRLNPEDGDWMYTTAAAMAGFLATIDTNLESLPDSEIARRDEFADLATTWLAEAIALGYDDITGIQTDPAFADLRDHPAFVKLMSGLKDAKEAEAEAKDDR